MGRDTETGALGSGTRPPAGRDSGGNPRPEDPVSGEPGPDSIVRA